MLDLDRPPKPDSVRPPEWNRPGISDGVDVLAALAEDHGVEPPPLYTHTVQTAAVVNICTSPPPRSAHGFGTPRAGWAG